MKQVCVEGISMLLSFISLLEEDAEVCCQLFVDSKDDAERVGPTKDVLKREVFCIGVVRP